MNFWYVLFICIFLVFVEIIGVFGVIGLSIGGDLIVEFGFVFEVIGDRVFWIGVSLDINRFFLLDVFFLFFLVGEVKCRFWIGFWII